VSVQNLEKNLVWSTFALDPTDPNTRNKDYSGPPLKLYYSIKPGKNLGGFSFKSPYPPGPVHYFAEGETGVPMSTPTEYDDEPKPDCPGFNEGPRFKTMLGGTTDGPMPPGTIPVALRLVKASGAWRAHECNPDRDTGEISVLVLPSRDFDPSTLTLSTVKFGYGEAPVLSSKALPDFKDRDEEWADWEKSGKRIMPDRAKENESVRAKKKPLLLTFDMKAVGIRCGLDKAIFLEGKTSDGKSIVGSVPISTKDCKPWNGKKTSSRTEKPKKHR